MHSWPRDDADRDWRRDRLAMRERRMWQGYSQDELARALYTTRQTISAIETGRSKPNVLLALAIARELDSTVEELFG
jgi:putative transcriptional regulator